MIVRRLGSMVALAGVVVGLASCSQLGQATGSDTLAIQHTYVYTAVGASDAVGFGSTAPCATAPVIIGPDTEQMPSPPNCPGGKGYVPGIASRLTSSTGSVVLTDLGISGAVVGPTERTLGNTWEPLLFQDCTSSGPTACIPGDFLSDELPLIPGNQDLFTIFAGGNDTEAILAHVAVACNGCDQQHIQAMITADVTNFAIDYQTLVGAIHQSHPFARIYIANLPNFGLTPRGICIGSNPGSPPPFCGPNDPALGQPGLEALLDAISTGIDANVINPVRRERHSGDRHRVRSAVVRSVALLRRRLPSGRRRLRALRPAIHAHDQEFRRAATCGELPVLASDRPSRAERASARQIAPRPLLIRPASL